MCYFSHIFDYVVTYAIPMLILSNEVANVTIVCDYYMFRWKNKMKVLISHPIFNGSFNE
jgi:hypothetical protein